MTKDNWDAPRSNSHCFCIFFYVPSHDRVMTTGLHGLVNLS
jgi:hypothetical protein